MKVFAFLSRRSRRVAAMALLATLLAACGGGGSSDADVAARPSAPGYGDPLVSFDQQELDWQVCIPAATDGKQEAFESKALALLGDRVRCARMRVPLDHDHPAAGELQIELLRVQAAQPGRRLGAIVLNPGGPGVSGLMTALGMEMKFLASDDARLQEMGERYDLVGFSPRGTGASNPLICRLRQPLEVQDSLTFNRSEHNLQAAARNARRVAEACLDNPLSRHIHTDASARDMELLRTVLGEPRLNYIGYSYGSLLGAWYARLFPARVGRLLLDSNPDIADLHAWQGTPATARQRILDQIMLPYAARHQEQLGLGDAHALRAALLALAPPLQRALFQRIDLRNSHLLEISVLWMSAAIGLHDLMQAHPQADEATLRALIAGHAFAPAQRLNEIAALLAGNLLKALDGNAVQTSRPDEVRIAGLALPPALTVNMSVRCNDSGQLGDARYWREFSDDDVRRNPLVGGSAACNMCLHWPTPARLFPAAPPGEGAPLLMLQSRYDGFTPAEQAMATLAALPQARMIVVEDEYQHGLFPYGTECVDRQVADYFLKGTLPQRLGSCAGKPQRSPRALRLEGG
jgi:pimeloyl-ACP methyl ester carboxylesterase